MKGIQWVIDHLVQRIIPIIATSFSSTVETFHALGQAEQRSQLEEAARRYEAEGKTEIASELRRRAEQLTSTNPAAQALEIFDNLAEDDRRITLLTLEASDNIARIADLAGESSTGRKKKPKTTTKKDSES